MVRSMSRVRLHAEENDRLDALRSYAVLGTAPEPEFDRLTAMATHVCDTPGSAITLVDADWVWPKSSIGGAHDRIDRNWSFCSDVVAASATLVVADATRDPRYRTNPRVTAMNGVRAYAGVPLVGRDGLPLGALCVWDVRARQFEPVALEMLQVLAAQVVLLLEARRQDRRAGLLDESVLAEAREPSRMRQALDQREFVTHFQPIVDLTTGAIHGLEALLRWNHPSLGILSPAAFLPLIESSSLVVPVGRAVLDAAVRQAAVLRNLGFQLPAGMAVNVASGQLALPGLADQVFEILEKHRFPAEELALEITETTALPDSLVAEAELTVLAAAGVHIVLDDFGVGWSNYSRLLALPVSAIKIDRTIASAVMHDERAAAVVAATVTTAFQLGVDVVAEGVETEDVRRRLTVLGCRWAQGWLFSPAIQAEALPYLLAATPRPFVEAAKPRA